MVKRIGASQGSQPLAGRPAVRDGASPAPEPTVDSILIQAVSGSTSASPDSSQTRVVAAAKAKMAENSGRDGAAPSTSSSGTGTAASPTATSTSPQAAFAAAQQQLAAAQAAYQNAIQSGTDFSTIAQGMEAAQQQAQAAYQAASQAAAQLGPSAQAQLATMAGQLQQMGIHSASGSSSSAGPTTSSSSASPTSSVSAGGPGGTPSGATPLPLGPLPGSSTSSTVSATSSSTAPTSTSSAAPPPPSPAALEAQFSTAEAALGQAIGAYESARMNGDNAGMAAAQGQALTQYAAACNALGQLDPSMAAGLNARLENDEENMIFYGVATADDMAPLRRAANLQQSPATRVAILPPLPTTSSSSASSSGSASASSVPASAASTSSTAPSGGGPSASSSNPGGGPLLRAPQPADGAAPGSSSSTSSSASSSSATSASSASATAAAQPGLIAQFMAQEAALNQAIANYTSANENGDTAGMAQAQQQALAAYQACANAVGQMDPEFQGAYDNKLQNDEENLNFYQISNPNQIDAVRKAAHLGESPVSAWADANQFQTSSSTVQAQQQLSQIIPKSNAGAIAKINPRMYSMATDSQRAQMLKTLLSHWWVTGSDKTAAANIVALAGVDGHGQQTLQAFDQLMGGTPKGLQAVFGKMKGDSRTLAISDLFMNPGDYSPDYLAQIAGQMSKSDVETLLNANGFDASNTWFNSLPAQVKQQFAKDLQGGGGGILGWFKHLFGNTSNTQAMIQALQAGAQTSAASTAAAAPTSSSTSTG